MEFLQHRSTRVKHEFFANSKVAYKPNPLKLVRVKKVVCAVALYLTLAHVGPEKKNE